VTACLISLQQFHAIASRHREIVEAPSRVQQFQFSLNDAPQVPRKSPSGPRASFAKQVDCCLISK
jgi:hypothetical protein